MFNVRSEQAVVAHGWHRYRPLPVPLSRTGKQGGTNVGTAFTGGYKRVRAVRPKSVAGGGWFEVFGTSHRIKPKAKYVRISVKEIWLNLDGPPKNKELWSYAVSFEFSSRK